MNLFLTFRYELCWFFIKFLLTFRYEPENIFYDWLWRCAERELSEQEADCNLAHCILLSPTLYCYNFFLSRWFLFVFFFFVLFVYHISPNAYTLYCYKRLNIFSYPASCILLSPTPYRQRLSAFISSWHPVSYLPYKLP